MNRLHHAGAFVVHFRVDADFENGRAGGRVEHIASGCSAHFGSVEELVTLFVRLLEEAESLRLRQSRQAG